jgi:hypothetical protein
MKNRVAFGSKVGEENNECGAFPLAEYGLRDFARFYELFQDEKEGSMLKAPHQRINESSRERLDEMNKWKEWHERTTLHLDYRVRGAVLAMDRTNGHEDRRMNRQ